MLFAQIDAVEFAQIEVKVFESLKAGNVALTQLHEVFKEAFNFY